MSKSLTALLTGLLASPSVRSAIVFGIGGVGFSLATLLLARFMPTDDFGRLALLLALIQVGVALGPAGLDLLVNRERLDPTRRIGRTVLSTASLASLGIVGTAWLLYDLPIWLLPALGCAILAAAVSKVGAAFFQSHRQFNTSLALVQVHNFILLATVTVAMASPETALVTVLWLVAGGYLATALLGWMVALRRFGTTGDDQTFRWNDGLHGVGIIFAVLVLAQTERIVIPLILSLEDMALFGVLAAVVVAPFRMLQLAVGYTLLPRLRNAAGAAEARQILRGEILIAVQVGLLGAAVVYWLGPVVIDIIVGDKYELDASLLLAAIGVGWLRLVQSISVATVNSLGDSASLRRLNLFAWLSLGVAVASATVLGGFGLTGVVIGVGAGWLVLSIAGLILASRTLSQKFPVPASTPS
ncbi:MAG: hypothetical protein AAFM91_00855 [Pseudomonadota bacterium]